MSHFYATYIYLKLIWRDDWLFLWKSVLYSDVFDRVLNTLLLYILNLLKEVVKYFNTKGILS